MNELISSQVWKKEHIKPIFLGFIANGMTKISWGLQFQSVNQQRFRYCFFFFSSPSFGIPIDTHESGNSFFSSTSNSLRVDRSGFELTLILGQRHKNQPNSTNVKGFDLTFEPFTVSHNFMHGHLMQECISTDFTPSEHKCISWLENSNSNIKNQRVPNIHSYWEFLCQSVHILHIRACLWSLITR